MGLPCTLLLTSSRFAGLPAIFQSFGSLSLTSFGTSSLAATAAMLPKLTVRWLGAWMDMAVLGPALLRRHLPLLGGSGDEHFARGGAGLAHVILGIAHGAA